MGQRSKEYGKLRFSLSFLYCPSEMDNILLADGEWHSFLEGEFDEEWNHYQRCVVFSKNLHVRFYQGNNLFLRI